MLVVVVCPALVENTKLLEAPIPIFMTGTGVERTLARFVDVIGIDCIIIQCHLCTPDTHMHPYASTWNLWCYTMLGLKKRQKAYKPSLMVYSEKVRKAHFLLLLISRISSHK
jgi:hypothetical protein